MTAVGAERTEGAASVNLRIPLSDSEYHLMRALLPHDEDIEIASWARVFSKMFERHVGTDGAHQLITEYNARLRKEYDV